MAERFFRATALAGDLHVIDFYDGDMQEPMTRILRRTIGTVNYAWPRTGGSAEDRSRVEQS